jgi:hypothetical protein
MIGLDQRTMEAISRGDLDAFARLFDRTSDAVRAEVTSRLPDADLSAAVFASTYMEVWWLAGCHNGPELDVAEWLMNILCRRIAGTDPNARLRLHMFPVSTDRGGRWLPSLAELDLAALLGRPVARPRPVLIQPPRRQGVSGVSRSV